mmetsp:Transcript_9635/g.14119  ORF Transcript_9635/g.14119 Transcript_9635/m.14119 type:complete len:678 (-) Transcript_9635:387-2420(-)|eukprot:CAMPEP_0195530720 /NCGR_PEP_ID=MMETSP0794_2-20130614/33741_1 /TAXON_ID=515487 /ORGANISM="Stephanopyxis turris, Strain CCMP 815" /LENGTH=677 /DNA_ID=CAMNT_0040662285 /DNA_START=80 /DNA_END=2113 /DNA_ORIENTATION=+
MPGGLSQEDIIRKFIQRNVTVEWVKTRIGWNGNDVALCDWSHIMCDPVDGAVTEILLHEQDLIVTIPTELGLLKSLQVLNFEGNRMKGTIPEVIFRDLPNLIIINFNNNNLEGTLPAITNSLRNLRSLELEKNRFIGTLQKDMGSIFQKSMEKLDLSHNGFVGKIPDSITYIQGLTYLDLSFNLLNGSIPKNIGNLKHLKGLFLNENDLIGTIPPSITRVDLQLVQVFLESNALSGTLPAGFSDLPYLTDLFVDGNKLTGTVPSELCKKNLNEEFFQGEYDKPGRDGCTSISCPVGTVSKEGVHPCFECGAQGYNPYLGLNRGRCFRLSQKQILDKFYDRMNGLNWQGGLGWGLSNVPPCDYEGVTCNGAGHVENITLRGMNLHGELPEEIGFLKHLRYLDLADNRLTGYLPSDLRFAPLEHLDLSGNELIGFVPPMLCLTGDINGNGVDGEFICDRISCRVGTYNPTGFMFQKEEGKKGEISQCLPCKDGNPYLGAKTCSNTEHENESSDDNREIRKWFSGGVAGTLLFVAIFSLLYVKKRRTTLKKVEENYPVIGCSEHDFVAHGQLLQESEEEPSASDIDNKSDEINKPDKATDDENEGKSSPLEGANLFSRKKAEEKKAYNTNKVEPDALFEVKGLMGGEKTGTGSGDGREKGDNWNSNKDEGELWLDVPKIV